MYCEECNAQYPFTFPLNPRDQHLCGNSVPPLALSPVFCDLIKNATRGSSLDRSAALGRSSATPASDLSTSWPGSKLSKAPHVPTRAAQPWSRGALHARLCGHTSLAGGAADEPACFAPELNSYLR